MGVSLGYHFVIGQTGKDNKNGGTRGGEIAQSFQEVDPATARHDEVDENEARRGIELMGTVGEVSQTLVGRVQEDDGVEDFCAREFHLRESQICR